MLWTAVQVARHLLGTTNLMLTQLEIQETGPVLTPRGASIEFGYSPRHIRLLLSMDRVAGYKAHGQWYVYRNSLASYEPYAKKPLRGDLR